MKNVEKIIAIAVLLASVFKIMHWPGAAILLTVSMCALSVFYLFFGFVFFNDIPLKNVFENKSYENKSTLRIIGGVVAGMALSCMSIALLFKLMHWPGSFFMLLSALLFLLTVLVVALVKYIMTKDNYYAQILIRTMIFSCVALVGMMGYLL